MFGSVAVVIIIINPWIHVVLHRPLRDPPSLHVKSLIRKYPAAEQGGRWSQWGFHVLLFEMLE